jgi:radical SAM protein (TIGR04043 family)
MNMGRDAAARLASSQPPTAQQGESASSLATLIIDLQARGLRVEVPLERRQGGAGPTDSGMLWVGGVPVTVPTDNAVAARSPYVLKAEDSGLAIFRGEQRLASASAQKRPRFYDLTTADGIPYWKIGLLHLDSFASTVVQTCSYWGNADQCKFCGIGLSLDAGRTIVKKSPAQLAEVATAAKELDGAVDATLTTGSSNGVDRGARYVARCARAVTEATGLPVEVQFEPPLDLDIINEVADLGVASVGIHVESFDPEVLARVAPGKARTGIARYFDAWERAVALFGEGQVSTYVILGMGEDPELTVQGCRRAIDIGVFPFVVPIRPVVGSLMQDVVPPPREYTERIYRRVAVYMAERGMDTSQPKAGCARCQACSALQSMQTVVQLETRPELQVRPLQISNGV